MTGNVLRYVGGDCALAFLQNLKNAGTQREDHEVLVRAGLLDGATLFGVSVDGRAFKAIDASGSSEFFVSQAFSLTGMINGVWGPDAKLKMKVGDVSVTVKQRTEGRLADSRSMLDLSVVAPTV